MIRLSRTVLPRVLEETLDRRTQRLERDRADGTVARRRWKDARDLRGLLRVELCRFAAGLDRCMYCGENVGTDVDHFDPVTRNPLRAFDWTNHLLACSRCNSEAKGFAFPCGPGGEALLIDPTVDDPYDHLRLNLSIGDYQGRTERGEVTIDVLRLNRAELVRGRSFAFVRAKSMLRDIDRQVQQGAVARAEAVMLALKEQPFADVLQAMLKVRHLPGAQVVLEDSEVLRALEIIADSGG